MEREEVVGVVVDSVLLTQTHLVENLAETKGSARSVLQRFEQDVACPW